jgi:NADH:ubiquinone oxidoreductase subunit 5 (subunit L)/multisubunit Na+/H+ antiporter MnhA subunit
MTPVLVQALVGAIFAAPAVGVILLALPAWLGRKSGEASTAAVVAVAFSTATACSLLVALWMFLRGAPSVRIELGPWFSSSHYAFHWDLVADRLSIPFAAFSAALVGLIGAFSRRYLHREPGFFRFYLLLTLFGCAVELLVLAGSLDLAFFGWELVGITSALLIAFFGERRSPVEHGLRAFLTYRACDIGLLAAALWLHHTAGSSAIVAAPGELWSVTVVPPGQWNATLVALLLLWASMGKAAQVPLSGWLPRAMEGPTPSSAIFYGAVSIHLGPYLLLRSGAMLDQAPLAAAAIVVVGAATAMHATFVGRVQTDIKSALAYASMTQAGVIFVEIGLGFPRLALAHIVGHACVRSLQILRSPSLLHDHHHLEQAMGEQLPRTGGHLQRLVPRAFQPWLYRHALERGYFDALLRDYVLGGPVSLLRRVDAIDRRWTARLAREKEPASAAGSVEEAR